MNVEKDRGLATLDVFKYDSLDGMFGTIKASPLTIFHSNGRLDGRDGTPFTQLSFMHRVVGLEQRSAIPIGLVRATEGVSI